MENLIATMGLLFFLFLVIATAVEVILEVFRGVLEWAGITWAKGKVTLDEALGLAKEFAPDNAAVAARLESVRLVASQMRAKLQGELGELEAIGENLRRTGVDTAALTAQLQRVAGAVGERVAASERGRVYALRFIAAGIGCALVYWADFQVFRILAEDPTARKLVANLDGLKSTPVNVIIGGLAAAAGSSYWHDMLDKVRSVKAVAGGLKKL